MTEKANFKGTVVTKPPPCPAKDFVTPPAIETVNAKLIDEKYKPEVFGTGAILKARLSNPARLPYRNMATISCGFYLDIPEGYEAVISIIDEYAKRGMIIPNAAIMDNSFEDEVSVLLLNCGREIITINDGDQIAIIRIRPSYVLDFKFSVEEK